MILSIPSASTFSGDIDGLVTLVSWLVGVWFFATQAMFFWLLWRFRARDGVKSQYITGKEPHLKRWINIPHALVLVCDVVIIIAAVRVWVKVKQTLPPPDDNIKVVGQQWTWTFQHGGSDGVLDTADDIWTSDTLHVEVNKTVQFQLESKDVLHSFFVPVFRLKQDAIPGRTITGWFQATQTGNFDILCAEICGIGHGIMGGRIAIESPEEHAAWVQAHTVVADAGTATIDSTAAVSAGATN
ncbi:MAG: cytochrome C oxidase subunit II [Candidatus Eisenbacteria bacterium]